MTKTLMRKEFLKLWANAQDGLFHGRKGHYQSLPWSSPKRAYAILEELFPDTSDSVLEEIADTLEGGAVWVKKQDYGML